MEVLDSDSDWKSTAFRQRVVTQIEKEMKKAGTAHTKSSTDLENHVYNKAKTREEYLSRVARLIIHFRDIHKMTQGQSGCAGQMQQPLQTTAMQQNMLFQHMNQQLQHPNQQHQAQTTSPQMMSSPSPVQVQTPQPASQPPSSQHNSLSCGLTPSAGGFQPSPSPQPSQSPASSQTTQSYPLQVPSPGPLNTPGNPSSVMSPAGASQSEDQLYMDKVKKLSKYIEPLCRLINKIEKNEDRKKVVSKMKTLLNILTDPNTRCSLKTLEKCEKALEKLKNDIPVQDAVMANVLFPVLNHSPTNTFAPAMTAIHGPPITSSVISTRKRKLEDDDRQMIPKIIQGEVALLDSMFHVNLDPSYCSNNGTVYLICKLDDDNLSSVPPLQLSIPADYPDQSPHWEDDGQQYEANIFLQTVHRNMTSQLLQLPDKHSVTALLNTWAQSVRQACLSAA